MDVNFYGETVSVHYLKGIVGSETEYLDIFYIGPLRLNLFNA